MNEYFVMPKQKIIRNLSQIPKDYLVSLFKDFNGAYQSAENFCLFVGYPRSGHSLVGSLLDAHPNAVIAHELNILKYFRLGFSEQQVYRLLVRKSQLSAAQGRISTIYSYQVPNQWQGEFRNIKVIGDKKGGDLSEKIKTNPDFFELIKNKISLPIKIVHVTRNPYDNIATISKKHRSIIKRLAKVNPDFPAYKNPLEGAINYYFYLCEAVEQLKQITATEEWLEIRHQSLIADPKATLEKLCFFFDLHADQNYLEDCASIILNSPHQTRYTVTWNDELIKQVSTQMERFDFLQGYSYQD